MKVHLPSKCLIGLVATAGLAVARPIEAQVGLTSGSAQVALVARVPTRSSVQAVSGQRESGRIGGVREVSVTLRMAANTGYQLRVQRTANAGGRVWVRTAGGEYQELIAGAPVTVVRDRHGVGEWERELQYRVEATEPAETLPVRYELAISPTM